MGGNRMFNLLAKIADALPPGGKMAGIGETALYALIGFIVVFIGIAFLIFVVWLTGKLMKKAQSTGKAKVKKSEVIEEKISESIAVADANGEEISEETVAVIAAALMAYYEKNNPRCEFTIKRIRKI